MGKGLNIRLAPVIIATLMLMVPGRLINSQISPEEASLQMRPGINLGMTYESVKDYLKPWGNPPVSAELMDSYKEAGFKCVRIPVTWGENMGFTSPFVIDEPWLNAIEEVVDLGLERDLFIILNAHHEGWIKNQYDSTNIVRFEALWTQISLRFKDKSEKLIFEILNEPHGLTIEENNDLHQRTLSVIREQNPTRLVIFQGNEYSPYGALLEAAIPDDDYVIGSFHSYEPYPFAARATGTWGSSVDLAELRKKFEQVSTWSRLNGIPVLLGEFGASVACDYNSRMKWYKAYVTLCWEFGFSFTAWETGEFTLKYGFLDRTNFEWRDDVKDILVYCSDKSPVPEISVFQDSIIKLSWTKQLADNDAVIIQRRHESEKTYTNLAHLKADTSQYYDVKPEMDQSYIYRVILTFSDSLDIYSAPQKIFFPVWKPPVIAVQSPFYGSPITIPGVIEAEDFDRGGEGLAYHDTDRVNIGGEYRSDEGVDIKSRITGGYHIGNALPGQWLEYEVDVLEEGHYEVNYHIAAYIGGGTFQFQVDTVDSGVLEAPSCYSWLTTKPVTTNIHLQAGIQILRFTVLSGPEYNIDKVSFERIITHIVDKDMGLFNVWVDGTGPIIVKQRTARVLESIHLYSINGSRIRSVYHPDLVTRIPSIGLAPGVYVVQAVAGKHSFAKKIVI